ncbi:hypothetical protein TNIN_442791 [Trichonephila inaurata madagascariensis]|uniref:Uncharacterized protein n=1 Tax=Trichonephila inaurata madagascariensis TaxID=2747483 RepID=A0A8X6XG38_9ARAC|nr:hypothetical protein TNIN_442791 [Trichonephila inaurata madagascariensis]
MAQHNRKRRRRKRKNKEVSPLVTMSQCAQKDKSREKRNEEVIDCQPWHNVTKRGGKIDFSLYYKYLINCAWNCQIYNDSWTLWCVVPQFSMYL